MSLSWDNVYLLCWFDSAGNPYPTTWDGDLPLIHVVVRGFKLSPPMWAAPVGKATVIEFPEGTESMSSLDRADYAAQQGGVYAFGWRVHHVDRVNGKVEVHRPAPSVWDRLMGD